MIINRTSCSWWPFLVAFLLLAIMGSLLFGGMRALLDYRNSADTSIEINPNTLHFFTKEYLQRQYVRLTAKKPAKDSTLPTFRIFADEHDLESLDSNLPSSGKTRYIPGHVHIDMPSFSSEMQFRYRGGLPLHWLYDKKSFRIKLPPYITYRGERQFNLVNPSTIHTITDWISYDMARSLGLLTPDYFPVRLYINNATNGLHFFLSRIDESFLRKNRRMPGSIYSGDTIYSPNPFGIDKGGINEATFRADDGSPLMWQDERLWEKGASRNAESTHDRRDLREFIKTINLTDPVAFLQSFNTYFDKEKYYLYWGLDTLLGAYHHDNFHNHKMYFDPYKGTFEPIEWDIRYWSSIFQTKDLPVPPLLRQVKLNPILEYERDLVTYELLEHFPVADIIHRIDRANRFIENELRSDPVRQAPDQRYGRFSLNKEVPFSMKKYKDSIEELKLTYQMRHTYLKEIFENSTAVYTLSEGDHNSTILTLSVSGNSPIDFDPWTIVPSKVQAQVSINRIFQGKKIPVFKGDLERLYPGRAIRKGNVLDRSDSWTNLAFGKEKLEPSPIHYQYLISGVNISKLNSIEKPSVTNAITGNTLQLHFVAGLPREEDTSSVHPWLMLSKSKAPQKEVMLSGEIDISEDRIYSKDQLVKILPGTIFRLSKGRSLVFYGKVLAEGTNSLPIQFIQKVKGEPWGSVVIQGKSASGSQLRYIRVSGGSLTTHRLINYPGQLNIHDVDHFQIDHCTISNNHIGDDALHISYSHGEINHCRFENTAFDALDMDIAEVTVTDSDFYQIGNDALDLMSSRITIQDVSIDGAGDKCISVGEESDVNVNRTNLHHCNIGIAVKDQSNAYVEELDFFANRDVAISLYQKNPRYSAGGTIDGQRLFGITSDDIILDAASTNLILSEAFFPSSGNVENRLQRNIPSGGIR